MAEDEQYYPQNQEQYMPMPQPVGAEPMSKGMLQYQIDINRDFNKLKMVFLAQEPSFNKKDGKYEYKTIDRGKMLINEKGWNKLVEPLRMYLSTPIFIMSDYSSEEEINETTKDLAQKSVRNMVKHWDEWDIGSTENAELISSLIYDTVKATLKKAYMHSYQNLIKTVAKEEYRINDGSNRPQPQPQPQSALTKIPLVGGLFKN